MLNDKRNRRLHSETLEDRQLMAGDVHDIQAETVVKPPVAMVATAPSAPQFTIDAKSLAKAAGPAVAPTAAVAAPLPAVQNQAQFVLQGVNKQNVPDATLAKADGLALRITWSALEPQNNKFNWTFLDQQMARADRMGKPVQFILLAGLQDAPSWLPSAGAKVFNSSSGMIPVSWDAGVQLQYKELIKSMQQHLAATGTLDRLTHIYTPGAQSAEWHFKNISGFYQQAGYSDANMVAGQVGYAKTLARYFPSARVVATIADHNYAWTATAIAQLKSTIGKGQMSFQINNASAKLPLDYPGFVRIKQAAAEGYLSGVQTVCASTNVSRFGGTYQQFMDKLNTMQWSWKQDYAPDVK